MYINKKILLISVLLPILSIFLDVMKTNDIIHSFGLPFDFFLYMSKVAPSNRLVFFLPHNLLKINFRLDIYIFDIIVTYFVCEVCRSIYSKIK